MCILFAYALLKVVNYYGLSVLYYVNYGLPNKVWMGGGWVGRVSSIQVYSGFFNFVKPLRCSNNATDGYIFRSLIPLTYLPIIQNYKLHF